MNGRNQLTVMGTTQTSAAPPRGPAWSHPAPGEPRWPASLAVLAILVLYALLPERLTVGPTWIVPALALALLVPLSLAAPHRRPNEPAWARLAALALIALVNLANLGSLILLVQALLQGRTLVGGIHLVGPTLLLSSRAIWLTYVLVFALWYGELDRGGPDDRAARAHPRPCPLAQPRADAFGAASRPARPPRAQGAYHAPHRPPAATSCTQEDHPGRHNARQGARGHEAAYEAHGREIARTARRV